MVSHSTPEAEIVAADYGIRAIGLPALTLWKVIMDDPERRLIVHEDNAAMIQICTTGKNPTMRGLGNTHGVSINRLYELFWEKWNELLKEGTDTMAGDIFTKAFDNKDKWRHDCAMINVYDQNELILAPRDAGGGGYTTY